MSCQDVDAPELISSSCTPEIIRTRSGWIRSQYARDLAYVKAIGGIDSTTRTPEQSQIAQFWYEDSPLGWNRIANTVIRQQGLDPWASARVFALVNFAMADGFIAGFDAKYRFRFWRPVTAIGQTDPSWQPFLTTPPVPDYPSTHTVLGWAAAQVLIELLGDNVQYKHHELDVAGCDAQLQGILDGRRRERALPRLCRHPLPARGEGRTAARPEYREVRCRSAASGPVNPTSTGESGKWTANSKPRLQDLKLDWHAATAPELVTQDSPI